MSKHSVKSVTIQILNEDAASQGVLALSLLPGTEAESVVPALLDVTEDRQRDSELEPIQLLEGEEYRYEFHLPGQYQVVTTDRPEVFAADTTTGLTGRLRPGLRVGTVPVTVRADNQTLGVVRFEVRARKLDYIRQYRWMLRDIAEVATEALMERFATAEQRFSLDAVSDATTLYQRFAFLRSLINDDRFRTAIQLILGRPHAAWIEEEEIRNPARGLRGSSATVRQLTRAGPRIPWKDGPTQLGGSLPAHISVSRNIETLDNLPNRFIKYALQHWRNDVAYIQDALKTEPSTAPVRRGIEETAVLLAYLDALLSEELFREVGSLQQLPIANQVLLKREGYRDVYLAHLQFELASQLSWSGGETVYSAGQRNVAALYEYWTFFQLAKAVSRLCHERLDLSSLVELDEKGFNLVLARGRRRVLNGYVVRLGRRIAVELWFNRTFSAHGDDALSWSQPMRPDCSLRLSATDSLAQRSGDVWLHFDAKYRVEQLTDLFSPTTKDEDGDEEASYDEEDELQGAAKRSDLLKMHAYRDAIRRSAGAYVLYPGTQQKHFQEYHELLPGLGAFALSPAEEGDADGLSPLVKFIDDVITHVASQTTQHERGRFWERAAYGRGVWPVGNPAPASPFLTKPPADSIALLGYVKGSDHLEWIKRIGRYNLRADGRRGSIGLDAKELGADFVVLYGPGTGTVSVWQVRGPAEIWLREQMIESEYPAPRGRLYLCLPVHALGLTQPGLSSATVEVAKQKHAPETLHGQPVVMTWQELWG